MMGTSAGNISHDIFLSRKYHKGVIFQHTKLFIMVFIYLVCSFSHIESGKLIQSKLISAIKFLIQAKIRNHTENTGVAVML